MNTFTKTRWPPWQPYGISCSAIIFSLYKYAHSDPSLIHDLKTETYQKMSQGNLQDMKVETIDIIKTVKCIKKNKSYDGGRLFSNHNNICIIFVL